MNNLTWEEIEKRYLMFADAGKQIMQAYPEQDSFTYQRGQRLFEMTTGMVELITELKISLSLHEEYDTFSSMYNLMIAKRRNKDTWAVIFQMRIGCSYDHISKEGVFHISAETPKLREFDFHSLGDAVNQISNIVEAHEY